MKDEDDRYPDQIKACYPVIMAKYLPAFGEIVVLPVAGFRR